MTDDLLSVKLLVRRLKLKHDSETMFIRTADKSFESQYSCDRSPGNRQWLDSNSEDTVVYRRGGHGDNSFFRSYTNASQGRVDSKNRISNVFQYPTASTRKSDHYENQPITSSSSDFRRITENSSSDLIHGNERSHRHSQLSTVSTNPRIRLSSVFSDSRGSDVFQDPCTSPFGQVITYPQNIQDKEDTVKVCVHSSPNLTPNFTGSQGRISPLLLESSNDLQITSLGSDSNRSSRSNSTSSNKPRLSISKSVPLSPQVVTKETRGRQLCSIQLKLDTLKAEIMAMRKTDQELSRKFLQLYTEIQVQKVKRSCMNHCELLDDAIYEAELADELPEVCDLPHRSPSKFLSSRGVTSFNISRRRFSCS